MTFSYHCTTRSTLTLKANWFFQIFFKGLLSFWLINQLTWMTFLLWFPTLLSLAASSILVICLKPQITFNDLINWAMSKCQSKQLPAQIKIFYDFNIALGFKIFKLDFHFFCLILLINMTPMTIKVYKLMAQKNYVHRIMFEMSGLMAQPISWLIHVGYSFIRLADSSIFIKLLR